MVLDVGRIKHRGDLMHKSIGSNGSAIPSNWRLSADGLTNVVWTPESPAGTPTLSYGSNANDVSSVSAAGAASEVTRADHVHRGVRTITSNGSNGLFGNVNLKAGTGIALGVTAQDITITNIAGAGGGGSASNTVDIEDEGAAEGAADTIDFTGAGVSVTFAAGQATVNIPGGGGSAIAYGSLKPGSPTHDFTGSDLASATAVSSQGSFAVGDCFEQALDGTHIQLGYRNSMGFLYWAANNVDQELWVGGLHGKGSIISTSGMYGIALLDTSNNGVGIVTYTDGNAYLAEILGGQYNTQYGSIGSLGHDGSTDYIYAMRLTRVGNTWDGYISLTGNAWDFHMSATGSKTITVARAAVGMLYNTATATYKGHLWADYLHTVT